MYSGKKAIVTGGMGFIGRNLVQALLSAEASVTIIDDCSNSSPEPSVAWIGDFRHIQRSVLDDEWFHEIDNADYVFHLACKTILECNDDPLLDLDVNAGSTLKILEYISRLETTTRPSFLYTSSASIYGTTPDSAVSEDHPLSPCSQYGVSKLAGENYTTIYAKQYNLQARSLRLSNVYGPGQTPNNPYCGVIGIFINQSLRNEPLTVIGDGSQTRDFTYVEDVVKAIMLTASNNSTSGKSYNVSSGVASTIENIAHEIISINKSGTVHYVQERMIDNIRHRKIDSSSITKDIGWKNVTSINEGLQKTIEWFKK